MLLGMIELLEECLQYDYTNDAILVLHRLRNMGSRLSSHTLERLVGKLLVECRVDDALDIIESYPMSDGLLVLLAEPLIMSGRVHEFSQCFNKFLCTPVIVFPYETLTRKNALLRSEEKEQKQQQLVASHKVYRVVKALFLARTRRFMSSTLKALLMLSRTKITGWTVRCRNCKSPVLLVILSISASSDLSVFLK